MSLVLFLKRTLIYVSIIIIKKCIFETNFLTILNRLSLKISLYIVITTFILSCNAVKKVPADKHLLINNEIVVNGDKKTEEDIVNQIVQKPNSNILGYRLRLNLFNMSKNNTDSVFKAKYTANPNKYKRKSNFLSKKQVNRLGKSFWYSGWHNFLRKTGEPPVIIDESKAKKTLNRLKAHYFNQGYFSTKTDFKTTLDSNKTGRIKYNVITGKPAFLDTITKEILSPALDSLYKINQSKSLIKKGKQFKTDNFEAERARITTHFRNNGVYHFQQQSIEFVLDTLNLNHKAPVRLKIGNETVKINDTLVTKPYELYKIGTVNIFTTNKDIKNKEQQADSAVYKNFNLYSTDKLRYRPKAITDAVFIYKDSLYSDSKYALTLRSLNNLRNFKYPNIKYIEDPVNKTLNANIYLVAIEKYKFKASIDATHSNIFDLGIAGSSSVSIRNVFRGAETLEIGLRGNIGASRDLANPDNQFFNISEIGADMRLSFPRLFMPFKTDKIIPKTMFPSSYISAGFARQRNIGLDKENLTAAINYSWTPRKNVSAKLDLVNVQYVKNVNTDNYFTVYGSSYNRLNTIARKYTLDSELIDAEGNLTKNEGGAENFIIGALNNQYSGLNSLNPEYNSIKSINERKERLTENNLIFASNFTFSKNNKKDIFDKQFYSFRSKLELAGNLFSLIANLTKQEANAEGARTLFGLEYSQYAKAEFDYVKYWDLTKGKVFAIRSFVGVAIPYGNSKSVPFARSYFAGGSNDNRAWQSYSLGPGSSGGLNDFNEANLKIALNAEFRFRYGGNFYGALFADCGNIWNVSDNEREKTKVFDGLSSLTTLALGTGTGFRYDFKFVVLRLDFGFKTYNPANIPSKRWFNEYNFSNSVLNIGINYPF